MSIIKKLDDGVVNRIAAGEVIQRPSSAVKELIENCIDAGSTSITLTLKSGGLQSIQIQDNGHGIHKDDLYTVCNRFTTSKLVAFEDLKSMTTFGFRGEALASISYVSKVTITSKTSNSSCAYRAKYVNGELIPWDAQSKAEPKPCAGMTGTTVLIEDLFYNITIRRKSFQNSNEEYQRILDVVSKYSVLYGDKGISFVCKKHGQSIPDLVTSTTSSSKDNICRAFGASMGKELLHVAGRSEELKTSVDGEVTSSAFTGKYGVYVIFINNRLVECTSIRRLIDSLYYELFGQQLKPFVYLSLRMPPENVDVNVHPTKKEVQFLHEEEVLKLIRTLIQTTLNKSNQSRNFGMQPSLGAYFRGSSVVADHSSSIAAVENMKNSSSSQPAAKTIVRTDASLQKIGTFFKPTINNNSLFTSTSSVAAVNSGENCACCAPGTLCLEVKKKRPRDHVSVKMAECSKSNLDSVRTLRRQVMNDCDAGLKTMFGGFVYVGAVDDIFSLVQLDSKMLLINHKQALQQLCYQLALNKFGDFDKVSLIPPVDIQQFIVQSLSAIDESVFEGTCALSVASTARDILIEHKDMLCEYFSLSITEDGYLESVPQLIQDCHCSLDGLPFFLKDLAMDTEWSDERQCFQSISTLLSKLFSYLPMNDGLSLNDSLDIIYFPLLKAPQCFNPSKLNPIEIYSVTELDNLYKIFERC